MEALVYFACWAVAIFLMMRVGCGAYVMGNGIASRQPPNGTDAADSYCWHPPRRACDPVCGRRVIAHGARTSVFEGTVYFFCSPNCREIFEAAPDIYAGVSMSYPARSAEQSHV